MYRGWRELTASDRCDAPNCGAPSKAVVLLPSGNELTFCRHHTTKYEVALWDVGGNIEYHYEEFAPKQRDDDWDV